MSQLLASEFPAAERNQQWWPLPAWGSQEPTEGPPEDSGKPAWESGLVPVNQRLGGRAGVNRLKKRDSSQAAQHLQGDEAGKLSLQVKTVALT